VTVPEGTRLVVRGPGVRGSGAMTAQVTGAPRVRG
jgi:hypothetical protein